MSDELKQKFSNLARRAGYNIGKFIAFIGWKIENLRDFVARKQAGRRSSARPEGQSGRKEPLPLRSVLITGASSGLGAELARQYAAPGVYLYLTGRDSVRLNKVAYQCQAKGAKPVVEVMDICDDVKASKWIASLPRLDLVIANAGVSGGTVEGVDNDEIREIFSVNVGGVLNVALPFIEKARKQQIVEGSRGQLAIIGSIAGMRALPGAAAYSASKACVSTYADALRVALRHEKIFVSSINPGYIRTKMTEVNNFKMPLLMEVEEAAYKIRRAISKRKGRYYFPRRMYYLMRIGNMLPFCLTDMIVKRFPKKG